MTKATVFHAVQEFTVKKRARNSHCIASPCASSGCANLGAAFVLTRMAGFTRVRGERNPRKWLRRWVTPSPINRRQKRKSREPLKIRGFVGRRAEPQVEILRDGIRSLHHGSAESDQHERHPGVRQLAKELELLLTYRQAVQVGHAGGSAGAARGAARSGWKGRARRPLGPPRAFSPLPRRIAALRCGQPLLRGPPPLCDASTRQNYSPAADQVFWRAGRITPEVPAR